MGSDQDEFCKRLILLGFNSRSRVGSDRGADGGDDATREFQFALPRGERPRDSTAPPLLEGFNSRSRVGSDVAREAACFREGVSIRAPAWGATWTV